MRPSAAVSWPAELLRKPDANPVRLVAEFHMASTWPWPPSSSCRSDPLARLLEWLLPPPADPSDPSLPSYLDAGAIGTPSLALTNAARETLHMGDLVETMLRTPWCPD